MLSNHEIIHEIATNGGKGIVRRMVRNRFEKFIKRILNHTKCGIEINIRDFKMWYGEAVVRRQIVKINSGDVMTRVPLRLSRRNLAFYYGKVPSFTYS